MPPVGFEPTIPAKEQLQTDALDRPATGIGQSLNSRVSIAIVVLHVVASKVTDCSACYCQKRWTVDL